MKCLLAGLLVLLVFGCSSQPKVGIVPESVGDLSGFHRVENFQQFDAAHIRSPEAFASYSSVIYDPLIVDTMIVDTVRIEKQGGTWSFKPADRKKARQQFYEQVASYYQSSGSLKLTNQPNKDVLRVSVELLKYIPNAPRDSFDDRISGADYLTEGVGTLFMRARIYDSTTDELMAVLEDRRELGRGWIKNDRANNARSFNEGLRTWISRIDDGVGLLKQLY